MAISTNRRLAAAHFRNQHHIHVGDAKEMVTCGWQGCHVPMRRGNMPRHILEVHLRLTRWTCLVCWKTLSRRAKHKCLSGGNMTVQVSPDFDYQFFFSNSPARTIWSQPHEGDHCPQNKPRVRSAGRGVDRKPHTTTSSGRKVIR